MNWNTRSLKPACWKRESRDITGYIPADQVERLTKWARRNSVALAVADPGEDDTVPTLVRNPGWLK